jgi:predicted aconitase with swiveling domain
VNYLEKIVMHKTFQGRPILPGEFEGEALVTRYGFNTYASFYNSLDDDAKTAICADSGNKDLFKKDMTGKIICLPESIGSTSAGSVWPRVAKLRVAPKAMLFSNRIDSLAAGGLLVADIWEGERIILIDQLGEQFLESVVDGNIVSIDIDGKVCIKQKDE